MCTDKSEQPIITIHIPIHGIMLAIKEKALQFTMFSKFCYIPTILKDREGTFSGGGGGNGMYSGGGGGSNRGRGGDGGLEISALCQNDPREGGYGGINIIGSIIQTGIFAGGGGGASTQAAGATASSGGNGGGIVIIIADTIEGNNHIIRSNGISAAAAAGNAGAGGGGAGGSIALSFQRL